MGNGKSTGEKIADEILRASLNDDKQRAPKLKKPENTHFPKKVYEANQKIFDENDVADTAYILRSGAVDIRIGTLSDSPSVLTTIKAITALSTYRVPLTYRLVSRARASTFKRYGFSRLYRGLHLRIC